MAVVVDASVAMGWLLRSQASTLSDAVEETIIADGGWVPAHFAIEIARTLRRFERRGELTPDVVDRSLAQLRELPLRQDTIPGFSNLQAPVTLARQHLLRVADAAYLELALRLKLPLATRDRKLATAAATAGAELFKS
jgi:predicted nucleic acid-binding protein